MKQPDLFVVFHASANVDEEKQRSLRDSTFDAVPSAVFCYNPGEKGLFAEKIGRWYINASPPEDAISTIFREAKGRKIAIVTLCPEMMKAASDKGISIVTSTPPEVPVTRCHTTRPAFIADTLRRVSYEKN